MTDPRTPDAILTADLVYAVFDDFIVPTYGVWGDDESEHRNMIVDAVAEAFRIVGVEALREQVRVLTEFEHQVANRTKEIAVAIGQALIHGVRAEDEIQAMAQAIANWVADIDGDTQVAEDWVGAAEAAYDAVMGTGQA